MCGASNDNDVSEYIEKIRSYGLILIDKICGNPYNGVTRQVPVFGYIGIGFG
jgi:hypothetical protein